MDALMTQIKWSTLLKIFLTSQKSLSQMNAVRKFVNGIDELLWCLVVGARSTITPIFDVIRTQAHAKTMHL